MAALEQSLSGLLAREASLFADIAELQRMANQMKNNQLEGSLISLYRVEDSKLTNC